MILLSLFIMIALLIVALFLPALRELRTRSDAQRLHIDETFILDPRLLGKARRKFPASNADDDGHKEPGAFLMTYVHDSITTDDASTIYALASDGSIFLGRNNRVEHWLDAEDDIVVSEDCYLGKSASSAKSIALGRGSVFTRLFGRPVMTTEHVSEKCNISLLSLNDGARSSSRLVVQGGTTLDENVVSKKSIQVGAGAVVNGSIKSHGSLEILEGARVMGNIFARGDIHLHRNVVVTGTVYAEGSMRCEEQVRVGTPSAYVSVFSGGSMCILGGVRVYGWIIAQRQGTVQ